MNKRKPKPSLSRWEVNAIQDAWHRARTIGLPLNLLITVMPEDTDQLTVTQRCKVYERIRNLCGQYARRRGFPFAWIWVREIETDGKAHALALPCAGEAANEADGQRTHLAAKPKCYPCKIC